MRHRICLVAVGLLLATTSGCAWFSDYLVNSLSDDDTWQRDGRDEDAEGLTQRDITARYEERQIRDWDRQHAADELEENRNRNTAQKSYKEHNQAWQDFLSRKRDDP